MSRTDDRIAQEEELEAIKAIYDEDIEITNEIKLRKLIHVTIRSDENSYERLIIQAEFILPDNYPSQSPPVFQINSCQLSNQESHHISSNLDSMYSEGEVVLYTWIEWIREYLNTLASRYPVPELCTKDSDEYEQSATSNDSAQFLATRDDFSVISECVDAPELIHGEPFTDRRSTFQAHCAEVHSVEEVKAALQLLKCNRKVASATHNILAYRLLDSRKHALVQDCDDDGEAAAGGRLLHLLQIMDVMNVVVVVTRWYGGIQLGPDRFKHINNVARILLQQTRVGLTEQVLAGSSKKKHKAKKK